VQKIWLQAGALQRIHNHPPPPVTRRISYKAMHANECNVQQMRKITADINS
jgi:hypothetical protein